MQPEKPPEPPNALLSFSFLLRLQTYSLRRENDSARHMKIGGKCPDRHPSNEVQMVPIIKADFQNSWIKLLY